MTAPSRRGFAAAIAVSLGWCVAPAASRAATRAAPAAPCRQVELNETARFVYERYLESWCPDRIASALTLAYEVDAKTAREDTDACLAQFRGMGLIV